MSLSQNFHAKKQNLCPYYPGQKNRYSRDIHEIDQQCDRVILMRHRLRSATQTPNAHKPWVASKLDIVRYHMIELYINLIKFSAVTIFFGQGSTCTKLYFEDQIDCVLRKDFNYNFHENQTTGATDGKKSLL